MSDLGRGAAGVEVKICGCRTAADALAAARAGADYFGLVFAGRTRRVTPERGAEIARAVEEGAPDSRVRGVGVFVDAEPEEVAAVAERVGLAVVQLHGAETPEHCAAVRGSGLTVWKAVRPRTRAELEELADRYAAAVQGVLVEGHSERAAGGTGAGFPHTWLQDGPRALRAADGPKLILAGGLRPATVISAIRTGRPDVVDVSSGVERAPGTKDPEAIRRFVENVRSACRPPVEGRGHPAERRA